MAGKTVARQSAERRVFGVFGALGIALLLALPARANSPEALIGELADQAIEVLRNTEGSLPERESKFRELLREYFAMQEISRVVAGRHWREMSAQQQEEFQRLFSEWTLRTYSVRLGGYEGETVDIGKAEPVGSDSTQVHTTVQGKDRRWAVDWRVREINGSNKIVDVAVDGVSMLTTQRSELASVIRREGIDGMLGILRQRLEEIGKRAGLMGSPDPAADNRGQRRRYG